MHIFWKSLLLISTLCEIVHMFDWCLYLTSIYDSFFCGQYWIKVCEKSYYEIHKNL